MLTVPVASGATCSWCHEFNPTVTAHRCRAVYCHNCGHRADVPRIFCDCQGCCALRASHVALALSDEDRSQMTEYAVDQIARIVKESVRPSPAIAASIRLGLLSYDGWRRWFGMKGNSDRKIQGYLRAMDSMGIDVEAVLRLAYEAGTKGLVN